MIRFLRFIHRFKALLPVLVLSGCLMMCRQEKPQRNRIPQVSNSANIALTNELSDAEIKSKIIAPIVATSGNSERRIQADAIEIKRCPCDPKLINITLPNDWIFTGQEGNVVTGPKGGGQSGGGDVDLGTLGIISVNMRISTPEESQNPNQQREQSRRDTIPAAELLPVDNGSEAKDESKAISVAIFDSGLNPNYVKALTWEKSTTLCMASGPSASSQRGWNFVANPINATTDDDQLIEHGSRVAYLLARQFRGSNVPVRIVPMEVLDKNNTGDLFSILCAMETARKNKVEVFNMSLGYYGDRDPVFARYIKQATDAGIWIIVAAGNQPDSLEERNLSKRSQSFYPAFFSREFDRVIAVTTMNGLEVCKRQNLDEHFVVGVKDQSNCGFRIVKPADESNHLGAIGTSYSTPVFAGWFARKLREKGLSAISVKRKQLVNKQTMQEAAKPVPGLFKNLFIETE